MRTLLLTAGIFLLLAIPLSSGAVTVPSDPVVLDSGPVQGLQANGVRRYLGIPYAAPPVGELRWRPPQPAAPWTEPRQAMAFGPACPQGGPLENAGNEDCLFLNVWTPVREKGEPLPVMVWIHGGGFNFGSASMEEYEGSRLARLGVVVVSLNYRLGPLGFLVHPKLAAGGTAALPANYGLQDQMAALAWVGRNIAAFGGDPGRVTLFGQSAGSRSVALLTLSPAARGLFQQAIAQSGGPIIGSEYLTPAFDGDPQHAAAMGRELGARLGCDKAPDVAACLRAIPAKRVIAAADCRTGLFDEGLFFAPVFDGQVLPRDPAAALADDTWPRVPMILGSTGNEGSAYLRGETGLDREKYATFLKVRFGGRADEAAHLFPAVTDADVAPAIDRCVTVAVNAQPARLMARSLSGAHAKAFLYRFTRRPDTARARELGAFHGVDLAYVFGRTEAGDGYTDVDRELSRQMMAYWVHFAKTGDPNGPGLPPWPVFEAGSDWNLNFADTVRAEQHLYRAQCDFIDQVSRFRPK